jgi:hypothetical protein
MISLWRERFPRDKSAATKGGAHGGQAVKKILGDLNEICFVFYKAVGFLQKIDTQVNDKYAAQYHRKNSDKFAEYMSVEYLHGYGERIIA